MASNQIEVEPPSFATLTRSSSSSIFTVHPDIIETQILQRLDASTLAFASCVSTQLNTLASGETLWTKICHSAWPSTNTPRVRHVMSTFPKGPRSFFSDSITNPDIAASSSSLINNLDRPSKLISAVDVYYQKKHVFSKVVQTEAFDSSLFRVDLLDPTDTVPTRIPYPVDERMMREIGEGLTLSWIMIDPIGRRAMNLSSYKPVIVERRWLSTEEVHVRHGWVFSAGEEGSATEYVKCGISVKWEEGCERGGMQVSKVSLEMEDMYGNQMSGEDSLVILRKGMAGKRGNVKKVEEEGKRRHEEYMELRRERILSDAKKAPAARLDTLSLALKLFIVSLLGFFFLKTNS